MRNKIKFLSFILFISFVLVFVGGGLGYASTGDYKSIPQKNNVDQKHNWTIKFDGQLDKSTVNNKSIYVKHNDQTIVNDVKITLNSDMKSVTVSAPNEGYQSGGIYYLYIEGIQSVDGLQLNRPQKMMFSVKNYGSNIDDETTKDFFKAIRDENISTINRIIASKKDIVNVLNDSGMTPLMDASERGFTEIAKILLEEGANPNIQDSTGLYKGETALHYAARNNRVDVVHELVQNDVNNYSIRADNGMTALMNASEKGYSEIVKLLIEAGANPNIQDSSGLYKGETALHYAARNSRIEVVQEIVQSKENDYSIRSDNGMTALMEATERGYAEIVQLLIQAGANPNIQDSSGLYKGETALHYAARNNRIDVVKEIVKSPKTDYSIRSDSGMTALMEASERGYAEVVQLFVQAGANPNVQDSTGLYKGETALHYAARNNRIEVVQQLVKAPKIDYTIRADEGMTALMKASEKGYAEVVKLMIGSGANPNIQDPNGLYKGDTALHYAARNNKIEVVKELLKSKSIKKTIKNDSGDTPLNIAAEKKYQEIVKLLK